MAAGDTYLHRVVAVLNAFRADDDSLGAAELARRSGLPRSTAHRIVLELVEAGLLERQGTRVRLGLKLFEIGQRVPRQRVLRDAAVPYMSDLREATRQTVHLAVLEGNTAVLVERLDPIPTRRGQFNPVGGRAPLHMVSNGKARSPVVVQTEPPVLVVGITCQMASSMLAVAPSSKARRANAAERSIWRTPGASAFCTSTIASSVMRQALRTHEIWSGVLTSLAGPTTCAASDGGPDGNSVLDARRIAPVSSSTATVLPAGTRSASTSANCCTPSSNSR